MKLSSIFVLTLGSLATARPRYRVLEGVDPLPEKIRITAFIVNENGNPEVQCWEIDEMSSDMQVSRRDGSKANARSVSLATSGELDGINILTWPSYTPIWPIQDDSIRSKAFDFSFGANLFSLQGGLIQITAFASMRTGNAAATDEEGQQYIFSLENGDDWFYFEDSYTGSNLPNRATTTGVPPLEVSTVSGSETEVINFRFPKRPTHRVLHKGACSFSGLSIPESSSIVEPRLVVNEL